MIQQGIYNFFFDLDIDNKALVKSAFLSPSIIICYLLFVSWIGPEIMKKRKPFDLRNVIITYNFLQSILNAYCAYHCFATLIEYRSVACSLLTSPLYPMVFKRIAQAGWILYLLKLADLMDTVFFVLRKKQNQVSFLHVMHHTVMYLLFYFKARNPSLKIRTFFGVGLGVNCTVHVVMYFYYALAAFGPSMKERLWWKRYLTQLQIAQFIIVLMYLTIAFAVGCEKMHTFEGVCYLFVIVILILFINFYRKYK